MVRTGYVAGTARWLVAVGGLFAGNAIAQGVPEQPAESPQEQPAKDSPADPSAPPDTPAPSNERPTFGPEPARLNLRVDAMAWYMGPGGTVDMPSTPALGDADEIDIDALGYDSPRFVAMPEVNITWGERWRVTLRGYHFDDSHRTTPGFAGQVGTVFFDETTELESTYSMGSYEAEVAYRVYEFPEELIDVKERGFFATADFIGGVRVFDLSWSLGRTEAGSFPGTQSVSVDEMFISPLIGTRLRLDFGNDMGMDVQLDVAGLPFGDGSNASGDVIVGGWWYPWPNVGFQIGYRAASYRLGTGDGEGEFTFAGWNQGLQFGMVLSF